MYLHLGQDVVVRQKDIIGIFDIDTTSISKITKKYLSTAEKLGRVVNVTQEIPKSFVICNDGKHTKVYISQISSATLKKRRNKALLSF